MKLIQESGTGHILKSIVKKHKGENNQNLTIRPAVWMQPEVRRDYWTRLSQQPEFEVLNLPHLSQKAPLKATGWGDDFSIFVIKFPLLEFKDNSQKSKI